MDELKEFMKFLGADTEKIKTIEDAKKYFEPETGKPNFIHKDKLNDYPEILKPLIGKTLGSIETKLKASAKKFAIEFEDDEFKDKSLHEKFEIALNKQAESHKAVVTKLTEDAGKGNDDKVKEWESKYSKLESKFSDTKGLLETTSAEFTKFKDESAGQIKGIKLNTLKDQVFNTLKLKQNISEIEKKGFMAHINENYKFDLDDTEKIFVADKDGKRIPSTKQTGAFKDASEILEEEGIKAGVWQINPHQGKAPIQMQSQQHQQVQTQAQQPAKQVLNPRTAAAGA